MILIIRLHSKIHMFICLHVYKWLKTFLICYNVVYIRTPRSVYTLCQGFLSHWRWPSKHYSAHLPDIFSEDRQDSHRDAKHIKCQASDLIALQPVLAHFVRTVLVPTGLCTAECNAFLAMCEMAEFIASFNRGKVTPTMMSNAVNNFLKLFVGVWGSRYLTPKNALASAFRKGRKEVGDPSSMLCARAVPPKS